MNQHLDTILKLIRQSDRLSDDEKKSGMQAVQQAEAELETKNRDLQIETSLERVRAVALTMKRPDDVLSICKIMFTELQSLGFSDLRNALINFWDDASGSLLDYDYSDYAGGHIARLAYSSHPAFEKFQQRIRSAKDAFAELIISESELDSWKKRRRSDGEYDDPRLENISALYYYFYSTGVGAIGISTFSSLTEEKLNVLKRFRNVFDLAYRRYMDVALAEEQAREAKIEASLERVRSKAMAMEKSEDLAAAVATIFEELDKLNLGMLRCGIGILNKEKRNADVWSTTKSDHGTVVQVAGDEPIFHPLLQGAFNAWLRQEDFSYILQGEDLSAYYRDMTATNFRLPDSQSITGAAEGLKQYYFVTPFKSGNLYAFRETPFPEEAKAVMKRFADVFSLTYTRFTDLKQAEARAREAQIEVSLERVRSKAMAMQKSEDLGNAIAIVFEQLDNLNTGSLRCGISIINKEKRTTNVWSTAKSGTTEIIQVSGDESMDIHPLLQGAFAAWLEQKDFSYLLEGEDLKRFYSALATTNFKLPDFPAELQTEAQKQYLYVAHFPAGGLYAFKETEFSEEAKSIIRRFGDVFSLTYTRFNDLRLAELQAHKAQIEVALERVRSRALAMQEPEELVEVAHVLRHEMGLLGMEEIETGTVFIFDEETETAQLGFTAKDTFHPEKPVVTGNVTLDLKHTSVGRELLKFFRSEEIQISVRMEGIPRREWIEHIYSLSPRANHIFGENIQDKTYHLYKFSNGAVGAASPGDISNDSWDLLKRAASVFSLAYSRFKDLSKARVDLQNLKDEKKRSDSLLLNILPEEIANELKQFGKSYARKHEQVTIMFADIKGFSSIAENLSAEELVTQLDECFRAFDHIVEKHGLEKIKTIGDAYVCACGLPKPVFDNAVKTVRAALDMLDFIKGFGMMKKIQNLPAFEFRVGIHTGPVVTGVVGLKKFTYDIWGDAVNMAARMEQHGEAGKINISGNTYQLVKDKFTCTHRGKIKAKNKGEVDMYFVEHVL